MITCRAMQPLEDSDEDVPPPVPVTIITGFLGAGKTSLLRHVLTEPHGLKIAVVQNEMSAAVGLEEATVRGPNGEEFAEWMELANGCVCCAVRDDLVQCMEKLVQMKSFDYILIETTGMADPGPVAASFWLDDALESPLKLDGIVTVVDGHNLSKQLGTLEACRQVSPPPKLRALYTLHFTLNMRCACTACALHVNRACTACAQIASADCLLLNKTDGLEPGHLAAQHAQRRRLGSATARRLGFLRRALQAPGGATHCAAQGSWEAVSRFCGLQPFLQVELEAHVRHLNPTAPMLRTEHSRVSVQAALRHPPSLPPSLAPPPSLSLAPSIPTSPSPSPSVRSPACFAHPRPPPLMPGDPQPARLRCAAAPPRHTLRGRRGGVGGRPRTTSPPRAVGPRSARASRRRRRQRRRRQRRRGQ